LHAWPRGAGSRSLNWEAPRRVQAHIVLMLTDGQGSRRFPGYHNTLHSTK